jgi:hypothetical protein
VLQPVVHAGYNCVLCLMPTAGRVTHRYLVRRVPRIIYCLRHGDIRVIVGFTFSAPEDEIEEVVGMQLREVMIPLALHYAPYAAEYVAMPLNARREEYNPERPNLVCYVATSAAQHPAV